MIIETVEIPHTGSFTLLGNDTQLHVKIVFIDRCRLEFTLTPDLLISHNSAFKFLDSSGSIHNLAFSSQSIGSLGISRYVDTGLWFVNQLHAPAPSLCSWQVAIEDELRCIRAARATHLRPNPVVIDL